MLSGGIKPQAGWLAGRQAGRGASGCCLRPHFSQVSPGHSPLCIALFKLLLLLLPATHALPLLFPPLGSPPTELPPGVSSMLC